MQYPNLNSQPLVIEKAVQTDQEMLKYYINDYLLEEKQKLEKLIKINSALNSLPAQNELAEKSQLHSKQSITKGPKIDSKAPENFPKKENETNPKITSKVDKSKIKRGNTELSKPLESFKKDSRISLKGPDSLIRGRGRLYSGFEEIDEKSKISSPNTSLNCSKQLIIEETSFTQKVETAKKEERKVSQNINHALPLPTNYSHLSNSERKRPNNFIEKKEISEKDAFSNKLNENQTYDIEDSKSRPEKKSRFLTIKSHYRSHKGKISSSVNLGGSIMDPEMFNRISKNRVNLLEKLNVSTSFIQHRNGKEEPYVQMKKYRSNSNHFTGNVLGSLTPEIIKKKILIPKKPFSSKVEFEMEKHIKEELKRIDSESEEADNEENADKIAHKINLSDLSSQESQNRDKKGYYNNFNLSPINSQYFKRSLDLNRSEGIFFFIRFIAKF